MYFGPGGNQVHSWLLRKKSLHRYVGSLLIIISLVVVWGLLLYQPLNSYIDLKKQQIIAEKSRLTNGIRAQKKCRKLKQKIKTHTDFLAGVRNEQGSDGYISFLAGQANKCGLILFSCSQELKNAKNKSCLTCTLQGTEEQILAFFDNIVASGANVGCSHVELSKEDDQFNCSCSFKFCSA